MPPFADLPVAVGELLGQCLVWVALERWPLHRRDDVLDLGGDVGDREPFIAEPLPQLDRWSAQPSSSSESDSQVSVSVRNPVMPVASSAPPTVRDHRSNIRATRARKKLDQADVSERMRKLGYTSWHRQTLGKVDRGERKLAASELLGLAYALETNIPVLLSGPPDDEVELGDGTIDGRDVTTLASGRNNGLCGGARTTIESSARASTPGWASLKTTQRGIWRNAMVRRSRRGRGTVFWDAARGSYVGQLSLGRDPQTHRRKRSPKVYAPSEAECWEKLDGLRDELRKTGTVAPRDVTVEMVLRDLLASPPAEWASPMTLRGNADRVERIIAALGSIKLQRLTVGQVERMLRDMAANGAASDSIRRARALLKRAIRRAERDGLVHRNVAELAEAPRGTVRKSKAMTLDQVRTLLASDLTPWWRAYIVTALTCGLRPGELLGLRWADVDLREATIRVRMCLKALPGPDGKRALVLADLKTERSRRTMALPRDAAVALRALKAQQAKDRLRLGPACVDSGLVFAAEHGGPRWPQDVRRQFARVCQRAGLGAGWHPHETRHTWVSVLSDAGVDIEDIADAAGHVTSSVTRNVYRHQLADKLTRAPAAMDAILHPGEVSGS